MSNVRLLEIIFFKCKLLKIRVEELILVNRISKIPA